MRNRCSHPRRRRSLHRSPPRRGPYQTDFPAEEFKARHAQVFEQIGDNAVAVVQGVPQTEGFTLPRQHNTFYYLSGIETPGAYLLLDGRTKKVTIYLPPRNPRLEAAEGRVLSAEDADLVKRIAGADDVQPLTAMADGDWPLVAGRRRGAPGEAADAAPPPPAIYAEFSPAENLGPEPRRAGRSRDRARQRFLGRRRLAAAALRRAAARAPAARRGAQPQPDPRRDAQHQEPARDRDDPPRVADRRASALMEAMRSTEPGVTEYQLDAAARYVFLVNDARLEGYRSITASGTENINNMHYFRNTVHAQGRRPGADGLRARLPLLRQRHRPRLAGQRQVHAVAARAAAVRARYTGMP